MPARLKVTLTQDEDKTLKELELANQVTRRIKQRASILRLNSRGKKATWKEEDWEAVEKWLSEERSYSARQLSQKLSQEKQITLGAEQVRRILVKKRCDPASPSGARERAPRQMALEKVKKKTTSTSRP